MLAVFKREFKSYMTTMLGPVFIGVMIAFVGIFFYLLNLVAGYPYFSMCLISSFIILIVTVPLLTMRSFAEDRKSKADQILFTSPLKLTDIVFGKFLAILAVFMIPVAVFCICPLIIKFYGETYLLLDYCTIFCYVMIGVLFITIGMYISSLTESVILAGVLSIGVLLVLYLLHNLVGYLPTGATATMAILAIAAVVLGAVVYLIMRNIYVAAGVAAVGIFADLMVFMINKRALEGLLPTVFRNFSVVDLLYNFFYYYMFDIVGIIKLILFSGLFLLFTVQSLEKRRWS